MKMKAILGASLVLIAACSGSAKDRELTVALTPAPPGAGYQLGGSVDSVEVDSATGILTARGWHMLTPKTSKHELQVYVDGAESVLKAVRVERPDVSEAVGDKDLMHSGFEIQIQLEPGAQVTNFCVTFDDKHYGPRLLNPHSPDQIRCTPAA